MAMSQHHLRAGRRLLLVALVGLLLTPLLVTVPAAPADAAAVLGTNRIAFDSNRTGNYEIFTMGTDGSSPRQLTKDARYDSWWPKISPDRKKLLFYRTPKGVHDTDYAKTSLWVMNADGTGQRQLIANGAYGWVLQGHAEWSPTRAELVMFAGSGESPQIWVTDTEGRNPRRITNRGGTNLDPSWSPDGNKVVFVGCPLFVCTPNQYEIFTVTRGGSALTQVTADAARDHDPYYSPDGTKIAWLREEPPGWAIFIMNANGTNQRPLLADLAVNSKPGWSLDSKTIYFHRFPVGRTLFNVFAITVATGQIRELEPRPAVGFGSYDNEYPVHSSF